MEYGNGAKVSYVRDEFKRVTGVRYDEDTEPRYTYAFDASGNAAKVTDNALNRTTATEYDLCNRPMKTRQMEGDTHLYTMELAYDECNRVSAVTERVGDNYKTYTNGYTYDVENKVTGITFEENAGATFTYDGLGRVASRTLKNGGTGLASTYTYVKGGYGDTSTTPLVEKVSNPGQEIQYAYDRLNRIESVTCNGVKTAYGYDKMSQLIRVNDAAQNKTFTYTYDRGGNILSKSEYAYTTASTLGKATKTVAYAYGDSNWKDKLTAYNGQTITYDEIGNPLSDGTWQYSWQVGRQLARIQSANENVDFAYDANGLRIQKTSTTRGTTRYTLQGKRIVHMTRGNVEMHFWYTAQETPLMVSYNGKDYYYLTNAQGDVLSLLDKESNEEMVSYTYDAWGKQIDCAGLLAETLGKENPFRYRGYVYDEETGWYYLRSRYYNPEWGRFVNADALMTKNLFTYCNNNTVNMSDPSGYLPVSSITTVDFNSTYNNGESPLIVELLDVRSGMTFDIFIKSNTWLDYHLDFVTNDEASNATFNEMIDKYELNKPKPHNMLWPPRPGIITTPDGKRYAVGYTSYPHDSGLDRTPEDRAKGYLDSATVGNLSGNMCMYFEDTKEGDESIRIDANAAAKEAYNLSKPQKPKVVVITEEGTGLGGADVAWNCW